MVYEAKNYDSLLGTAGFSDQLLKNHFQLYKGYVDNTNKLLEALMNMIQEGTTTPAFAEMKRRFGWEFNGMRLHELYFDNMSRQPTKPGSLAAKQLAAQFGSLEQWEKAFRLVGAMRGIGWAVLAYDPQGKKFFNLWINEHDVGHLTTTYPLLIMDVFEHAFMLDYGLKRADYISAFFNAINWNVVGQRLEKAQH